MRPFRRNLLESSRDTFTRCAGRTLRSDRRPVRPTSTVSTRVPPTQSRSSLALCATVDFTEINKRRNRLDECDFPCTACQLIRIDVNCSGSSGGCTCVGNQSYDKNGDARIRERFWHRQQLRHAGGNQRPDNLEWMSSVSAAGLIRIPPVPPAINHRRVDHAVARARLTRPGVAVPCAVAASSIVAAVLLLVGTNGSSRALPRSN